MRLRSILPVLVLGAACLGGAASAEQPAAPGYRAPVLAPLASRAPGRPDTPALGSLLSSPGGRLAAPVAVFVLAMGLASLASKRC